MKYNCLCFHWPHLHVIHFVQWIDEMLHNSDVNRDKNILLILFFKLVKIVCGGDCADKSGN